MDGDEAEIDPGDSGHAKSATLASPAREPGSIGAPPVAGADAYARQEGYSQKVLEHMSKARAGTTRAVYASKWAVFPQYCQEHNINAFKARSADIAEFLTWAFEERKSSPRTLQGYRSAIAARLRLSAGYDPGQDEFLTQLLKSFLVQRPVKDKSVIRWDLKLVLHYLKHGRLRLSANLNPRDITLKMVFLLALASGKRRGELHALEPTLYQVGKFWSAVKLKPRPDFLGKTHFTTSGAGTFQELVIPALSSRKQPDPDEVALCPVHTLRAYKEISDKYRAPAQKRLIISFVQNRDTDISAQSVSNYLKWLVTQAYQESAEDEQVSSQFKMTPHDLRDVATSLKAITQVSMHELLAAGTWASMDTFLNCYIKQFSRSELTGLYELGPFVSAGSILQERQQNATRAGTRTSTRRQAAAARSVQQ